MTILEGRSPVLRAVLRMRRTQSYVARSGDAREGAETVVFRTPSAVAAFQTSDICYLEVFGHKLVIHLSDGRVEQLNHSLSQACELLPQDRFLHAIARIWSTSRRLDRCAAMRSRSATARSFPSASSATVKWRRRPAPDDARDMRAGMPCRAGASPAVPSVLDDAIAWTRTRTRARVRYSRGSKAPVSRRMKRSPS